jgi:hypothetical protein
MRDFGPGDVVVRACWPGTIPNEFVSLQIVELAGGELVFFASWSHWDIQRPRR